MLTGTDLERLLGAFEQTAFRLESLDKPHTEEDWAELWQFLDTEVLGPSGRGGNAWVRSMTDQGKSLSRVHILRSPLNALLRHELAAFRSDIAAGESIGIIDRAERDVQGLPDHDFWLFDDRDLYRLHHTPEGDLTGAEPLPPDRLPEYRAYRARALAWAVPFADWWAEHGE
ncbi:DUF6879 family protein [Streptomyces sp. NPDC046887]|uniref:DUF6879 family protein n=1 Tax=Streptomyces sp. NPDC046887 TaxID=3155472 RepID=UPI0033DFFA1B